MKKFMPIFLGIVLVLSALSLSSCSKESKSPTEGDDEGGTGEWEVIDLKEQFPDLPELVGLQDIFVLDENHIWLSSELEATSEGSVIISSIDGGDSWQLVNAGCDLGNMNKAVYLDEDNGISVSGDFRFIYTTNGGASWSYNTEIENDFNIYPYAVALGTESTNSYILYGDYGGEDYSTGNGLAFMNIQMQISSFLSFDDYNIESYSGGGIDTPSIVNNGSDIFIPNLRENGTTQQKLGIYSNDILQLIEIAYADNSDHIEDIYFLNSNEGWLITNYDRVYKTTDAGRSWEFIYNSIGEFGGDDADLIFTDSDTGYCVNTYAGQMQEKLYQTTDGGSTWNPVEGTTRIWGLLDVNFTDKKHGFAVGGGTYDGQGWKLYKYSEN